MTTFRQLVRYRRFFPYYLGLDRNWGRFALSIPDPTPPNRVHSAWVHRGSRVHPNTRDIDYVPPSKLPPCPRQTPCCNSAVSRGLRLSFPLKSRQSWTGHNTKLALEHSKMAIWHGLWTISIRYVSVLSWPSLRSTSVQVLDTSDPTSLVFRTCLHELKRICGIRRTLPRSHTPLGFLLEIDRKPATRGYYGSVYTGSLGGSKVRVKRLYMSPDETGQDPKVRHLHNHFPQFANTKNP